MIQEVDVAIIGAGAAGIAAGRAIAETHLSLILLEAGDRIGGRAWTYTAAGMPLDLGCGWLHSADRNHWAAFAEAQAIAIDRTPPAWGTQFADLGFDRKQQSEAAAAFQAFDKRLREDPPASDRAADVLAPDDPWNGYLNALSSYINGAELRALSVQDYLAYDDADTGVNWRLPDGFGALIAGAARDLPVALGCAATLIDRRSTPLLIETSTGRLAARAAIVAVPSSVLASEALRFDPELPDKAEAAAGLPLGLADKLFLRIDQPEEFDADRHLLGNPHRAETGSYYLRPFGRPLIEVFLGGSGARLLEREGPGAMEAFAIEELCELFGSSLRRRLHALARSEWGNAEWICGSYSHALPGRSSARAVLAASVEDRIFFAGEACSPNDFSTAHGAHATGEEAARAAIAALTGVMTETAEA